MRVFVAGATGVLGRAAVPRLIAAGHQVTGVARTPTKARQLHEQGAEAVTVDLFDPDTIRAAVEDHDAVVHMATSIPPLATAWRSKAWDANDRLRREGTRVLVDAASAAGITRFVKETVCFYYSDCGDAWIDERTPTQRHRMSAASLDAEDLVTGADLDGVVLRFGLFYSADSRSTEEYLRVARTGFGPVVGSAAAYQPSVHVDDAADAVVAALDVAPGTYNVADEPITKREWNDAFAAAFGTRRLRTTPRIVLRLGGQKLGVLAASRRVTSQAFRQASGWMPRYRDATVGLPDVAATWKAAQR